MHSSRVCTICCSGHVSCHVCPPPCTPPAMHASCHSCPLPCMSPTTHAPTTHTPLPHMPPAMYALLPCMPPPCTELLTQACENITFPQLLLRTVMTVLNLSTLSKSGMLKQSIHQMSLFWMDLGWTWRAER